MVEGLSCRRVSIGASCYSLAVCEAPSSKGCRGSTHPAAAQSNYFQTGSETHSAKGPKGAAVSVPGHCPGSSAQGIVSTPSWVKGSLAGCRGPPGADLSPWDLATMKDRRHLLSKEPGKLLLLSPPTPGKAPASTHLSATLTHPSPISLPSDNLW